MKRLITLNLAGRKNFDARFDSIIRFLNEEKADIVCLQEVTFDSKESLAHTINEKLDLPYTSIQADLAEEYERESKKLTDGLAILARGTIVSTKTTTLTKVPEDKNGRPDFHKRIAQIVEFDDGAIIANTHLASNNNSYLQFAELLNLVPERCILTGDFNLPKNMILANKQLWNKDYSCSIDFINYISFPKENRTFDYFLIPKTNRISNIRITSGLSDHNAIICDIDTVDY